MNRLAQSLSPYLLQHKDNPVDWYPWGDEAFNKARQTDRPIFLSVGYAACHWCHVMEHESFEDEATAQLLNDNFLSIKVDREERPDIDQIYMNAVQLMNGNGGWPMSVFLTHDHKPFFAGTYWPPAPHHGMPGFPQVLHAVLDAWTQRRQDLDKHAGEITLALEKMAAGTTGTADAIPNESIIGSATGYLMRVFDRKDGGFGGAPKFPHVTDLELLLQRGARSDDENLVNAAEFTLDRMAAGGIRDHVGGGFSRYSVDGQWLVPHFEKMLYDNSLLGEIYVRAFQVTGHVRHADVAREIFDYLCRNMVDSAGGFHCSEDADSEGVEGKFYVWTPDEVVAVLGDLRGQRFCRVYDITDHGNFEGSNIPNLRRDLAESAAEYSVSIDEMKELLAVDREQLRQTRNARVHPGRDDKVLTAWNSLASKALAVGGAVLDEPRYIDAAIRAAQFTLNHMTRDDGRLLHAFRDGNAHLDGYLDDYAYTAGAFISLFEATADARWIDEAVKLADIMLQHFEDTASGGFFYTADDGESLLTRNKDWHDGSLVSGNAAATIVLLHLSQLCDRNDFRAAAERTLQSAGEILQKQAAACGALVSALDRYYHGHEQLVLAVPDHDNMIEVRAQFLAAYRPLATHSWIVGDQHDAHVSLNPISLNPISLNQGRSTVGGEATLYRCQDFVCDKPIVGDELCQWFATDSKK